MGMDEIDAVVRPVGAIALAAAVREDEVDAGTY